MSDRHRTLTPAPVSLKDPATIGDAMQLDEQHAFECNAERQQECKRRDDERASKDGVFWARIVALEAVVAKIEEIVEGMISNAKTNLKLKIAVATIAVTLLGAATTVGIFVAKYAIVGAITIELDKRLPPRPISKSDQPEPAKTAVAKMPFWSPIRTAQAGEDDR